MDWEELSLGSGEEGECLLYDVGDEGCAEDRPESDGPRCVPLPCAASKCEDDLEKCEDCSVEDCTDPVDSSEFGGPRVVRLWVVLWEVEEVDWRQNCGEWKIDVESPTPSC